MKQPIGRGSNGKNEGRKEKKKLHYRAGEKVRETVLFDSVLTCTSLLRTIPSKKVKRAKFA